jgi:hypothetical protein
MSTTSSPDPRDEPEAFLREEFDGLEHVLEAVAERDFGELSKDAAAVLETLDDYDSDGGESA